MENRDLIGAHVIKKDLKELATRLVPGGSTSPESWKLSKRVDLGRDQLNQLNHPRENDTLGDYSDLVYKKNSGKFYRE